MSDKKNNRKKRKVVDNSTQDESTQDQEVKKITGKFQVRRRLLPDAISTVNDNSYATFSAMKLTFVEKFQYFFTTDDADGSSDCSFSQDRFDELLTWFNANAIFMKASLGSSFNIFDEHLEIKEIIIRDIYYLCFQYILHLSFSLSNTNIEEILPRPKNFVFTS